MFELRILIGDIKTPVSAHVLDIIPAGSEYRGPGDY